MKNYKTMFMTLLLTAVIAACEGTAAQYVTDANAAATAQIDQYTRDALSTQTTRDLEVEQIVREMKATDDSLAATAMAINATVTAAAEVAATETQAASVLATQAFNAGQTATAVLEVGMTQTAQVIETQTTLALTAQEAEVKRAQWTSDLLWMLRFVAGAAGIVILAVAAWVGIRILRKQGSVVRYGPNGNPLIIHDNGKGQTSVINPMVPIPVMHMDGNGNAISPLADLSSDVIAQLAAGWLYVLTQQAQHNPHRPVKPEPPIERENSWQLGPVKHATHTRPLMPSPDARAPVAGIAAPAVAGQQLPPPENHLPPRAPWRMLDSWRGGSLPLGVTGEGLLLADPESSPHLLMAGTSGSGKTRYGLRPLIAAALADGWQVIIFDRSGLDFLPFRSHPNAVTILLSNPADAVDYLQSLYGEIARRFEILREAEVSTWGRLPSPPGPRVLAVFDEFSNLADSLDNNGRDELWRGARMVAAEGRKSGVHLALALQDPTAKSLDLRIRRNCTPLAFRVKDGEASRVVLGTGGAESLPPRQFMTVMDRAIRAVAFDPEDGEIAAFISARQVAAHPSPSWLDRQPAVVVDDVAEQVRALAGEGLSINEIQRRVFGTNGGRDWYKVKEILGATTTTTT